MQTATFDPTAGETARRRSHFQERAELVGDPTDPLFHNDWARDPFASAPAAPRRSALMRPHITTTHRPADRPLGSTHGHLGEGFLPADVRGDPMAGHVLGHAREMILSDGADAEGRPSGHVLGRRGDEQPPADLGQHVEGLALGPVPGRAE